MTPDDDHSWIDEAAGPLVRPFAMTKGRTRPANKQLNLITMVVSERPLPEVSGLTPEHERIVDLCKEAASVAEIAAHLDLPLVVAKVLVSDLMETGHVIVRSPARTVHTPDKHLLQAVLNGIRRL
jgi:hypothetical protein